MKILFWFLIGILTTAAYSQKTAVSDFETYTDPQNLFSIAVPKDWAKINQPSDKIRFEAVSENGMGATNFNIIISQIKQFKSLTPMMFTKAVNSDSSYFVKAARKIMADAVVVSKGKTLLGNKDAAYAIIEGNYGAANLKVPVKFYILQTVFESNFYTVTFTTGKADFESFYPAFKNISASLKINSVRSKPAGIKSKRRA